ncbi:MAG TPA: response regulator [Candidatus Angelobacter sp.]|jgi:DNA-binding response OmpR family regulator|nr:response regulator [Candidatus Angelobacter sp.]
MAEGDASYASGIQSVAAGSRAVELLPEGTGRLGARSPIGPRLAYVIDSTPTMRTIAGTLLEVHGFTVESFDTFEGAVSRCGEQTPDVAVMEPHHRERDALDVLRGWHDDIGEDRPPVVWCTTVTPTREHLQDGADLGLRGVVIKPFRLEALAALVVRVVRTHERERLLRDAGVDLRAITGPLRAADTAAWLRVESQLAERYTRPLSLVSIGAATPETLLAVRTVIRNVDLIGLLDARTAAVLLPDVPPDGAAVVARRVANAVMVSERVPAVRTCTREPGESGEALLERALRA